MIARTSVEDPSPQIYDVIIVGAGPCGLATAARLRERHPSALFTDEEQARYSWISRNAALKKNRPGKTQQREAVGSKKQELRILVLDETGDVFMQRWNSLFEKLQIEYLRSPMFFHPDPRERDALLAYCHGLASGTKGVPSTQEIMGCVGKELSKHTRKKRAACAKAPKDINERERQDYFAPSAEAFGRFCGECVERYGLCGLVTQAKVEGVQFDLAGAKVFTIRTDAGVYHSRTVVLAVGGGEPVIPASFDLRGPGSISHALDTKRTNLLPPSIKQRIGLRLPTYIAIIGGGLTAAQVADCILKQGVSQVHLCMRGPWKIKPFDIDLVWMGKWRNHSKAEFWSEEDLQARLEMAKAARGGGSITPRYTKCLRDWIKKGRLVVHMYTPVTEARWDTVCEDWELNANSDSSTLLPRCQHVILATGLGSDINTMPMLSTMHTQHPIDSFGGFPALTADLMWKEEVPLFVTGKLAMLQLGPGAGNLEGARLGAERVAWGVEGVLGYRGGDCEEEVGRDDGVERYVEGIGSKYEGLRDEDSGVDF